MGKEVKTSKDFWQISHKISTITWTQKCLHHVDVTWMIFGLCKSFTSQSVWKFWRRPPKSNKHQGSPRGSWPEAPVCSWEWRQTLDDPSAICDKGSTNKARLQNHFGELFDIRGNTVHFLKCKFPVQENFILIYSYSSLAGWCFCASVSLLTCKSWGWCWSFAAGCTTQTCWLVWHCSQKGSSGASSPRQRQPALSQYGDLYASKEAGGQGGVNMSHSVHLLDETNCEWMAHREGSHRPTQPMLPIHGMSISVSRLTHLAPLLTFNTIFHCRNKPYTWKHSVIKW